MISMTTAVAVAAVLSASLTAQHEETKLPFVEGDKAFEEAARTGKRVLVYQDWPA